MISSNESFPFKCRIIAISFIDDKKEYQKKHLVRNGNEYNFRFGTKSIKFQIQVYIYHHQLRT